MPHRPGSRESTRRGGENRRGRARYVLALKEHFHLWVDINGTLHTDHRVSFFRLAILRLHYSLVGVPPLAGFFGKLLLFGAAIDAGYNWLAVVAIANSVLSLGVYLRLIVPCYQAPKAAGRAAGLGPVPAVSLGLVVGLGLGVQALVGHIG